MHLSYEASPCANLTNSTETPPLNIQLSHLSSISLWPGEPTCTGTPLRGFGRVLSQVGHRDTALSGMMWDKLGCSPLRGLSLGHFPDFRPWLRAGVVGAAAAAVLLTVGAALGSATSPL